MSSLICPNCKRNLKLSEEERRIDNNIYDVWMCDICSHILVLDWRYSLENE